MIDKVYEGGRLFLENHDYILNNVFMFDWESDLFALSKSKYAVEIEVKVSRSDFKADFLKKKHDLMKMAMNQGESMIVPNRFYFACPEGMIFTDEVPSYAGLIYCDHRFTNYHVMKKAPLIHKGKIDFETRLLSKYYNTSMNTRSRLRQFLYGLDRKPICLADIQKEVKSILRLLK